MKRALSRKNLWDQLPRTVKAPLGWFLGKIPPRFLLGAQFRRKAAFVRQAQWWPSEQLRAYQLAALKQICTLAYDKTGYYRRQFDGVGFKPEDLTSLDAMSALPTMDKNTVRQHLQEMLARPATGPGIDYCSTGGTSGTPLAFYMGKERSATEYAYLTVSWERLGYQLGETLAVLRGRVVRPDRQGLYHEYDPLLRHHYYSNFHMTDENMGRYLKHIATLGPCFLHVYPSSVAALAQFILRRGGRAPENIRGIIAESEMVYPEQRKMAEEVFGCRYFSCYGHSEKLVQASECEHSTDYHVWPTYGYFELLDDHGNPVTTPGQRGEIVGTGFINTVMPFIRYRTGDYAVFGGNRCEACGREHTVIRSLEGRWPSGGLFATDGAFISMTAINLLDDSFSRVKQFQFYQDTPGKAVLKIIPTDGFGETDGRNIQRSLGRKFEERLLFTIQTVESIPLTPSGKTVYVDQRIGRKASGGQPSEDVQNRAAP